MYKLTALNRLTLLETLPFHGDWKMYRIYSETRQEVGFDSDEIAEWDEIPSKEFEIPDLVVKAILGIFDELDTLTPEQLALKQALS